jgi:predicted Zn finger-like uncharacterized protein
MIGLASTVRAAPNRSMLTQCPNCQTIFRVTSEILRVADGQVRCGRCQRQFDALARLIDENEDEDAAGAASEAAPKAPENFEVDEPVTHEDITMEGRHIEISGTYRVPDRYGNGSELQQETTEEWVEIDDAEDEPVREESYSDASNDEDDAKIVVDEHAFDDDDAPAEKEQQFRHPTQTVPARATDSLRLAQRRALRANEAAAPDPELFSLAPKPQPTPRIWTYLVAPLALLLMAQWVHSYRATLARHPTVGGPLQAVYRTLGVPLTPNWDLHAYQIRQWGVMSDPATPGTLRVRATITNLADFAQPYPLLRLVLEDRWGEQIRAREFDPSEYLEAMVASNRLMNPGQQANATIAIVDPGPDAEGFRFDVCLKGVAGTVCGEEVRRR